MKLTPHKLSASYFYVGADTTLKTIVAPASNTKGIVVHGANVFDIGTAGQLGRVMYKATAPASVGDTAAITVVLGACSGGTSVPGVGGWAFPCVIPPGMGLYAQKDTASAPSGFAVQYEVLT